MSEKNLKKRETREVTNLLKSIDSKLSLILSSITRFEEFVLEVSPSEARDEIEEVINELSEAHLDGI